MREPTTRYVLLGMLAMHEAMTGYEIRAAIELSVRNFWQESFGQIYPELRRLADERLIRAAPRDGRGRDAQPWRITPAGRGALREWLGRPPQRQARRDETLLKIFFSRHAEPGTTRALIASAREAAVAQLEPIEAGARMVLSDPDDPDLLSSLLVIDRGRAAARAQIAWCERALELCDAWEQGGAEALLARWRKTP
jgi:DNA-binding PadR family transcriptional regulator